MVMVCLEIMDGGSFYCSCSLVGVVASVVLVEAMAEMVTAVRDHVGEEHIIYINVMNRLSVDCDCDGHPAEPDIHDIGILASADPVALDQACIDLVRQAEGSESLIRRIESRSGLHTLEYAEQIGLRSRNYTLVNLDTGGK